MRWGYYAQFALWLTLVTLSVLSVVIAVVMMAITRNGDYSILLLMPLSGAWWSHGLWRDLRRRRP